jgi:hypothetical protein
MHQQLDHLDVLASPVHSTPQKRNLGLPGMDSLALSGCSHMLVVETCNMKIIERKTFQYVLFNVRRVNIGEYI